MGLENKQPASPPGPNSLVSSLLPQMGQQVSKPLRIAVQLLSLPTKGLLASAALCSTLAVVRFTHSTPHLCSRPSTPRTSLTCSPGNHCPPRQIGTDTQTVTISTQSQTGWRRCQHSRQRRVSREDLTGLSQTPM